MSQNGQGQKSTVTGVNAQGNPINNAVTLVFDGIARPVTANAICDANADARVDACTIIRSFTKPGKLVQTQIGAVSPDGRTLASHQRERTAGPECQNRVVGHKPEKVASKTEHVLRRIRSQCVQQAAKLPCVGDTFAR